jgi:hypothetical protein
MRRIVVFPIVVLGVACAPKSQPPPPPAPPAAGQTPAVQVPAFPTDPVGRWMECEECQDGELAAVTAMGAAAVSALATYLTDGPPADRLAALEQTLRQSHSRLPAESQAVSQADYVARYRANYVAKYQTRAATALGAIRTPEALRFLAAVDTTSVRGEVRAAVRAGLRGRPR